VDLADRRTREAFLDGALVGARRALVLTEGLLIYLDAEQVRAIAEDLAARPAIAEWILDLQSRGTVRLLQRGTAGRLGPSALMRFGPEDGVAFFAPLGWMPREVRSMVHEARRLHRLPRLLRVMSLLPEPRPDRPGRRPWSAIVRFVRSNGEHRLD
jgi:O-methyltransferase involved in polyketide biosynthesis